MEILRCETTSWRDRRIPLLSLENNMLQYMLIRDRPSVAMRRDTPTSLVTKTVVGINPRGLSAHGLNGDTKMIAL